MLGVPMMDDKTTPFRYANRWWTEDRWSAVSTMYVAKKHTQGADSPALCGRVLSYTPKSAYEVFWWDWPVFGGLCKSFTFPSGVGNACISAMVYLDFDWRGSIHPCMHVCTNTTTFTGGAYKKYGLERLFFSPV